MSRDLRIALVGGFIAAMFGWYAVGGALDGRGRDAVEGGVPAVILGTIVALVVRRMIRRAREE